MAETKQTAAAGARTPRNLLPLILLGLTAVVVALTIYVLARNGGPAGPDAAGPVAGRPATPAGGPTEAEQVLARARGLLAAGDERIAKATPADGRGDSAEMRWAQLAYQGARDLARAYVRAHPGDVEIRPVLADALCRLGEYDQAEQVVDRVLRRAPRSAAALWTKGEICLRRGDGDHAEWFRAAARSPAADARIWARYGAWLARAGRRDEAEEYLRRALDAGLADPATVSALGRIALWKDRFEEAERMLEQATRGERADPDDLALLAEARINLGRPEQAARALNRAMKLDKGRRRGGLLMLLGKVRVQQGRQIKAARAFEAATKYRLLRGEAAFRAARCYYFAGRHALAMKYIDLAAAVRPGDDLVLKWVKKVEDARFGPSPARTRPAIGLPPFGRK